MISKSVQVDAWNRISSYSLETIHLHVAVKVTCVIRAQIQKLNDTITIEVTFRL